MWPLFFCFNLIDRSVVQSFPLLTFSEVVLLRPYIFLPPVHSLKRPGSALSRSDDIFAITSGWQAKTLSPSRHCPFSHSADKTRCLLLNCSLDLKEIYLIAALRELDGWCYRWLRLGHWYSLDLFLGVPFNATSLAPPEGNGGRKNVEGGSGIPPGILLDGEAERWTDDKSRGGQSQSVASGSLAPCYVLAPAAALSAPRGRLHSGFGKVIPFTHTSPIHLLPASSSLRWHPGGRWWVDAEGWRKVWECCYLYSPLICGFIEQF